LHRDFDERAGVGAATGCDGSRRGYHGTNGLRDRSSLPRR